MHKHHIVNCRVLEFRKYIFNLKMSTLMFARKLSRNYAFSNFPNSSNYASSNQLTKTRSTSSFGRYLKKTFLGVVIGAITYDGYNGFEVFGGISRFLRSLKIAALISADYSWNLYGIKDGTDEYNRV